MPAVTVLTAVYNGLPYLHQALDSVLNQTFTDFEFLLIDDGSTDGSSDLLRQIAATDHRIRLIHHENRGLVACLNEGLALANGRYVARFDADDLCRPNRLAQQVAYLDAHPDCVLVGGFVELIDAKGRPLRTIRTPIEHEAIDAAHLAGHTSIPHPVATFRRDAIARVGPYDARFEAGQDLDLWLRLAEVGRIHNLPLPLIEYRQHEDSISSVRAAIQLAAMQRGCQEAWRRRKIQGRFEPTEHWRPGPDRHSRLRYTLAMGWGAFLHGHRRTAIIYGAKSVRIHPFSVPAWKLLAASIVKSLPAPDPA